MVVAPAVIGAKRWRDWLVLARTSTKLSRLERQSSSAGMGTTDERVTRSSTFLNGRLDKRGSQSYGKWRRERDSNPREAVSPYTISSRARSSTPAPLREVDFAIIPALPLAVHRKQPLDRDAPWPGEVSKMLTTCPSLPYDDPISGNAGG